MIEAGSFVHPRAVPQMADTGEVFQRLEKRPGVEYRALIANLKGVERAAACGCKKVKLNVSASRAHNLANLNCTPAETVALAVWLHGGAGDRCAGRLGEYAMLPTDLIEALPEVLRENAADR